jgi:N-dimethylarginine dimethylaminohydrolase
MYIVGLNSQQRFYFISKLEQREELEEKGFQVLNTTYEKITAAADAVRELNNKAERENRRTLLGKVG